VDTKTQRKDGGSASLALTFAMAAQAAGMIYLLFLISGA
jgi:hypothetical protein